MNDSEMSMRWNNDAGEISPEIAYSWIQTNDEKNIKEEDFNFLRKRLLKRMTCVFSIMCLHRRCVD